MAFFCSFCSSVKISFGSFLSQRYCLPNGFPENLKTCFKERFKNEVFLHALVTTMGQEESRRVLHFNFTRAGTPIKRYELDVLLVGAGNQKNCLTLQTGACKITCEGRR